MKLSLGLRRRICDTLRMLAADAVEQASSGHPGAPMGQADVAFVLFHEFLRFDPTEPSWAARDRFVLSCGHASMLLYGMLHLWGYDVSLDDLRAFRQLGSRTPGHPEVGVTPGVELTSGPLGQGVANSVGMALTAKMVNARVSTPELEVMPQRIFALCSDGDLMEGLSAEAASLAGHWRLGNLVWLYDDNAITIEGPTDLAFSENIATRFEGYGWRILRADGHDHASIRAALTQATAPGDQPSLVICRTHIGFGSPNKVDTSGVHGAPLGANELSATKAELGWPATPAFLVPDDVRAFFQAARAEKIEAHQAWETRMTQWRAEHPGASAQLDALWATPCADALAAALLEAVPASGATRKLSYAALQKLTDLVPALVGGSSDLGGSNGTNLQGAISVGSPAASDKCALSFAGRQLHFGIREHAMGAITNGMLLHGGMRPFGGTFLVFSDYMRPTLRLAALSHLPNIFIFSHDSIFVGEDGPTHQAIEHHWALRLIPGLTYFRPADGIEVAMTWAWALGQARRPAAIGLTRQGLPVIERDEGVEPQDVWRGGYIVRDADQPDLILVGTGSELHLCTAAVPALEASGHRVRVVSMVAYDLFLEQEASYREHVLPSDHAGVVTIEAGSTGPWRAITGRRGLNIGIDRFGASAPYPVLAREFGFTVEQVTARIQAWIDPEGEHAAGR